MRTMSIENHVLIVGLALLLYVAAVFNGLPLRPQMWLYPLVRKAAQSKLDYQTRTMPALETEHFRIKYTPADAESVPMVAEASEQAYQSVTALMGYRPQDKIIIVIQPSREELRRVFGWTGTETAMGVYWGGSIQLLSPRLWMTGKTTADFVQSGPMVHEFTHLVLDYMTNGNYSRWFTEGLAQYMEYQVNGYEWRQASNMLNQELYSMPELEGNFDGLQNQSLAYRESFMAVRYIAEVYGNDKLQQVIVDLTKGQSVAKAIQTATGLTYADFVLRWPAWAVVQDAQKKLPNIGMAI
ncbi:MAG: collagenase [Pelosinus sp.]|nr:collagenase [Pelosinus sp.]